MIDWRIKLTSRKFWMAVVAFITPLLLTFGVSENVVSQIVAIIMAGNGRWATQMWWYISWQKAGQMLLPSKTPLKMSLLPLIFWRNTDGK